MHVSLFAPAIFFRLADWQSIDNRLAKAYALVSYFVITLWIGGNDLVVSSGEIGIGKAIVREILYLGSKVVIWSREGEMLEKAEEEFAIYLYSLRARLKWKLDLAM